MGFLTGLSARAWAWLGLVALVAFLGWRGYGAIYDRGVAATERKHQAALAGHIQRAQAQARAIALQDAEVATETIKIQRQIEIKYRDREIEVIRNVKVDDSGCPGLTQFGYGLLNSVIAPRNGGTATNPGKPADRVPGPDSAKVPGELDKTVPGQSGSALPGRGMSGGETGRGFRPILLVPSPALGPI